LSRGPMPSGIAALTANEEKIPAHKIPSKAKRCDFMLPSFAF
jgi:hypothetical protein